MARPNASTGRGRTALDAERYRLLAEYASDVVFRSTPRGEFEWISPSVREVLGYQPEQLIGRPGFGLVHPDDQPKIYACHEQLNAGESVTADLRFRQSDGTYRWLCLRARPVVNDRGEVIARVGGWRDIDAEVQTRNALEQSHRLLEERVAERTEELHLAIAELQRISELASRDLQQPLLMVTGLARSLRNSLAGEESSPAQLQQLDQLLAAATEIEMITRSLGSYASTERDQPRRLVTVRELVQGAAGRLSAELAARPAELVVDVDPALEVLAVVPQITDVLEHLLRNCLEHAEVPGQLRIQVDAQPNRSGHIHVVVLDNGTRPAELESTDLVEPFVKGPDSVGPGMGLAYCARVVRRHGGSFEVSSPSGDAGFAVAFTIPGGSL